MLFPSSIAWLDVRSVSQLLSTCLVVSILFSADWPRSLPLLPDCVPASAMSPPLGQINATLMNVTGQLRILATANASLWRRCPMCSSRWYRPSASFESWKCCASLNTITWVTVSWLLLAFSTSFYFILFYFILFIYFFLWKCCCQLFCLVVVLFCLFSLLPFSFHRPETWNFHCRYVLHISFYFLFCSNEVNIRAVNIYRFRAVMKNIQHCSFNSTVFFLIIIIVISSSIRLCFSPKWAKVRNSNFWVWVIIV